MGVPLSDEDLRSLSRVIKTVIRRHVTDPLVAEDLCQEALINTTRAAQRLDRSVLDAYAAVTARNTALSHHRAETRRHAKHTRLHATTSPSTPPADEQLAAIDPSETSAARQALNQLNAADRELLHTIDLSGTPIGELAHHHQISPATLRVRLARARARARTRYAIALHGVQLPTERCLPILDALSAGDQTRQRALGTAEHLTHCPTCASLAEPLLTRRRPLLGLLAALGTAWAALRRHPRQTAAGVGLATALVAAPLAWDASRHPTPPPPPLAAPAVAASSNPSPAALRTPTIGLLPVPAELSTHLGEPVTAEAVPVLNVVADEAFWVGSSPADRLLVRLTGTGESPITITAGQRISFTGTLTPNPADLAATLGRDQLEGSAQLTQQGV
ncbi:MAG: RNA polymerase sigma factor, partial [Acidimicrobiia bacterium]